MTKSSAFSIIYYLLLIAPSLQAQTQLSGTVQDKTTKVPIEFAHIFFLNQQHIGVITNQLGQFILQVPESLRHDTIVISQMGYHHYYLPLKALKKEQRELQIALSPNQFMLEEAVVIAEAGLRTIVSRAIERIPQNYPTEKHRLKAYYREYSIVDSTYTHLTESFVTIQDKSYVQAKDCDIFVHELRKSNDERDPTLPHILLNPEKNELLTAYQSVRTSTARHRSFSNEKEAKQFINKTDFDYLGQTIIGKDTLIRIGYRPYWSKVIWTRAGVRDHYFVLWGELVINKTDYAIVKHRTGMKRGDSFWETQYRKTDGRYYPSLILNLRSLSLREETISHSSSRMYHIYSVEPNKKKFLPLGPHKRVIADQPLREMKYVYRPDFWKNNTILLDIPANIALEKDLNRKQSLRDQFEENARRVKTVDKH